MNLRNINTYSKFSNDIGTDNILLNSYNQVHNNKFSSFAQNEIMQNIKKDKYYSINRRISDDLIPTINDGIYDSISPFIKERNKKNYYESASKNIGNNIYNYGQLNYI